MTTATFRQYLLASDWLPVLWHGAWTIGGVVCSVRLMDAEWTAIRDVSFLVWALPIVALSVLLASQLSLVSGWFVFGPVLYAQGLENGGPFRLGDHVQCIAGRFRGRTGTVYSTWQHETVRVDLGDAAKKSYGDIFAAYQLPRVPAGEPNETCQGGAEVPGSAA